ncbi:hypothetical protein CsSME_00012915 [Camellia sinensis var. sinensis]
MVRYTWFVERFRGIEPKTVEEPETVEETEQWNIVGLYLLSALVILPRVRFYDWGGAGLTTLYEYMSSTSHLQRDLIGGYWRAWEGGVGPVCRCLGRLPLPHFS